MTTVFKKKAKKKGKQIKFVEFKPSSDPAAQDIQTICPRQSQPPRQDVGFEYTNNHNNNNKQSAHGPPPPKRPTLPGANLPQSNQQFTLPGATLNPAFSSNPFPKNFGFNQNSVPFVPFQQQPQGQYFHNFPQQYPNNFPQQYPNNFQQQYPNNINMQTNTQPQCVLLANQAQQIARSMLPQQKHEKFNNMFNDFIMQAGTNPNFNAESGMKKLAKQLIPNNGYDDDFVDYTQEQPQVNQFNNNDLNSGQITALDHKFMDMMQQKIEKQIDNEIKAAQEYKNQEVCKFYLSGCCKFGANCRYYHPIDSGSNNIRFQEDQECCICFSLVIANSKQFGLLTGCDHAFCLECIRKWRGQVNYESSGKDQSRLCPICRKQSYVVIPSNGYIRGKEKQKMMQIYKAKLKSLPCKHFNFGKQKCPFLNSCFYSHKLRDGTEYEYPFQTPEFSMQNQEWVEDDKNYQTLSSKLDIE